MVQYWVELDDRAYIRHRSVYDIITLISEVSGFADVLFVAASYLLGVLYTPYVVSSELFAHLGKKKFNL